MDELIKVEKNSINGREINTVNAKNLHSFLDVGRDFSTWIKARIKKYSFVSGQDFLVGKSIPQNGGAVTEYHLSIDMAKELSMVERNDKGKQARQYFIECERRARSLHVGLPQDLPTALRMYANEVEQKQLAISQRDEAIRTKAEIGSRREATAMARLSVSTKEVTKLKDKLGDGPNWKTTRTIPWVSEILAISRGMWIVLGKKLTALSSDLGYEVRKTESDRFGKVNTYHIDVIEKLRCKLEADENMLGKYRICEEL